MKIWFDFSKLLQFNSRLPVLLQIQRKYVVVRFWFMLQKIFEHNNRNYLRDYYYFRIRDMSRRSLVLKHLWLNHDSWRLHHHEHEFSQVSRQLRSAIMTSIEASRLYSTSRWHCNDETVFRQFEFYPCLAMN